MRATDAVRAGGWRWGVGAAGCLMVAVGCSFAQTAASGTDESAGLLHQQRAVHSPAGRTLIEQWHRAGETVPQVVRATRYVSGMSLVPGVALVFHTEQRQWMLSRDGALQALTTLEPGRAGAAPPQAPALPEQQRWRFEHAGRSWQLAIFAQVQPQAQPGIATEEQHSLDLLLWQWQEPLAQ